MDIRDIFDQPPVTFERCPQICAAGRHSKSNGSVAERLRSYNQDDTIAALKYEANIPTKSPPIKYKLPPIENNRHRGRFVESFDLFLPPITNRYHTLVNDLKETSYHSYWTGVLGRSQDAAGRLPVHIHPKEFVFGAKVKRLHTAADSVNPNLSYGEVADNYIKGHEFYKRTHNSYYVNEKKDFNYTSPPFNPNTRFGYKSLYDERGIWLKDIMHAKKRINKYSVANFIQSGFQTEVAPKLGQSKVPNHIAEQQPPDFCYGSIPIQSESMATILTENTKPETKFEIEDYLNFLNTLRRNLKKRFNKLLLSFHDLCSDLKYYDKEQTGWISFDVACQICTCFKVNFDKDIMLKLLTLLSIYKDGLVNYRDFINVLNFQSSFPEIGPVYHNKPEKYYYQTSYRSFLKDMANKTDVRTAGTASIRFDLPEFIVPDKCRASELSSYGGETLAGSIIYPSIYILYGLSHRDLLLPRPKLEIHNIFMKVGYIFDEDEFEKLWKESVEIDKNELVCVETFKNVLHEHKIPFDTHPGKYYEPEEDHCFTQSKH